MTPKTQTAQNAAIPNPDAAEQFWAIEPSAFTALPETALHIQRSSDEGEEAYQVEDGVAVIPIEGVISRSGYWGCSTREVANALDQALADSSVRAILFAVHSPGGVAAGVKELSDSIALATRVKPCAAWVDGLCASAAYWLASATGRIYAGPSATVGSIGVLIRHMDLSGFYKANGIAFTYVTAGSYKAVGNPETPLSDRDIGVMQARANQIYDMFSADVAEHMGLAMEQRETWADGRTFLGAEAEQLGLITSLTPTRLGAVRQVLKETHMDRAELAQKFPDLWASIQADAATEADRKSAQARAEATEAAQGTVLSLVATVCGAEAAQKVEALVRAGVTPEQLKAAAAALAPKAQEAPKAHDVKSEMLAAMQAATPAPVSAAAMQENDIRATIERIGKMKV